MGIADATRHRAHVLTIDQHSHTQRLKDSLDKCGNQMGGSLLVLQSPCKIPRDTRELGQSQYLFIGNIGDGDVHYYWQQMMLTQPEFLDPLHDHHIVTDCRSALSLEHLRKLICFHP